MGGTWDKEDWLASRQPILSLRMIDGKEVRISRKGEIADNAISLDTKGMAVKMYEVKSMKRQDG